MNAPLGQPCSKGPRRALWLMLGSVTLVLGVVGVALPLLPTTPFLIVAAIAFARSSVRAHRWLLSNRLFGRRLCDYLEGRGVPWKNRLYVLLLLWVAISLTALRAIDALALQTLLFAIAALVTLHVVTLPGSSAWARQFRDGRVLGRAVSAFTYLSALGVAWGAVEASGLTHPLVQIGLGTFVATVMVFGGSILAGNSSVYDPYWSLQPAAIVLYYLVRMPEAPSVRQTLVVVLVLLYALRLTSNFYRDWPGLVHEDFRYRDFRAAFGRLYWPVSFFGIHLFPTIMVYLGCLPLYPVMTARGSSLSWLDVVAALLTLGAVALAFAADEQMRAFRRDARNMGLSMDSGLWAHSRHPNYLGEVSTWWGLFLFALAHGLAWWWTGVGALAITVMFVFVSVPMMERRALTTRLGYREYREVTPMLLPALRRASRAEDRTEASEADQSV